MAQYIQNAERKNNNDNKNKDKKTVSQDTIIGNIFFQNRRRERVFSRQAKPKDFTTRREMLKGLLEGETKGC